MGLAAAGEGRSAGWEGLAGRLCLRTMCVQRALPPKVTWRRRCWLAEGGGEGRTLVTQLRREWSCVSGIKREPGLKVLCHIGKCLINQEIRVGGTRAGEDWTD